MYDSRTDRAHSQKGWSWRSWAIENKVLGYSHPEFGTMYRAAHQAPAPDYEVDYSYEAEATRLDAMIESDRNLNSAVDEPEFVLSRDNALVWTTSTQPKVAVQVVMDLEGVAKAKRRRYIESEMAKGVLFPDLDPYTLEPIRVPRASKFEISNVRTARRRYF